MNFLIVFTLLSAASAGRYNCYSTECYDDKFTNPCKAKTVNWLNKVNCPNKRGNECYKSDSRFCKECKKVDFEPIETYLTDKCTPCTSEACFAWKLILNKSCPEVQKIKNDVYGLAAKCAGVFTEKCRIILAKKTAATAVLEDGWCKYLS